MFYASFTLEVAALKLLFLYIYIGNFAFSSRVSPKSEAPVDDEKGVSVEASYSSKPSNGYLGRDTIANAAARVGPAVVNLSVPQG